MSTLAASDARKASGIATDCGGVAKAKIKDIDAWSKMFALVAMAMVVGQATTCMTLALRRLDGMCIVETE